MKFLLSFCFLVVFCVPGYCQITKSTPPTAKELAAEKAKAAKGNADAMYRMGEYYYKGSGVVKNFVTARTWFTKAAAKNNTEAMLMLGGMYEDGEGVKKDPMKALEWLKKAATKGNTEAANELGEMYESGDGVPENMVEAVKWYRIAADKGSSDAMVALGFCYMEGDGVGADKKAGYDWFVKAANAGDPSAMRYLGDYYAQNDMGNDCLKALDWYMKAADAGDTDAIKPVGVAALKGDCPGIDKEAIAVWMNKQADKNIADACFYLGGFYIQGVGVAKNHGKAMELLIKDRELANYTGARRNFSTNNLLTLYNSGELSAEQSKRLLTWFERTAVKTNDDEMMAVLANIYINKDGAKGNDYRTGLDWAMKSAEKGNPGGCFWVGFVYAKGLDVRRNDVKAFTWMLKAAEKGDKDAMKMVSSFYESGTGTEKNKPKAAEWKAKAESED